MLSENCLIKFSTNVMHLIETLKELLHSVKNTIRARNLLAELILFPEVCIIVIKNEAQK